MQPNGGGQGHVKRPSSTRNAPVSVPIGGQGHVKRPSSTRNSPVTTAPVSPPRDELKQPRKLSMFDRVADSMHHFGSSTHGGRRSDSREKDTLNKIKAKLEFQSFKVKDILCARCSLFAPDNAIMVRATSVTMAAWNDCILVQTCLSGGQNSRSHV
eukprot:20769-Heterococcus_DN1.PRE.2